MKGPVVSLQYWQLYANGPVRGTIVPVEFSLPFEQRETLIENTVKDEILQPSNESGTDYLNNVGSENIQKSDGGNAELVKGDPESKKEKDGMTEPKTKKVFEPNIESSSKDSDIVDNKSIPKIDGGIVGITKDDSANKSVSSNTESEVAGPNSDDTNENTINKDMKENQNTELENVDLNKVGDKNEQKVENDKKEDSKAENPNLNSETQNINADSKAQSENDDKRVNPEAEEKFVTLLKDIMVMRRKNMTVENDTYNSWGKRMDDFVNLATIKPEPKEILEARKD